MLYSSIISITDLARNLTERDWVIIDCRFDLFDPGSSWKQYKKSHIPGALYAHLDNDLCGPMIKGITGRHPLPSPEEFAEKLGTWGIDNSTQVIAYDDAGGSMAAARLWWLLRWLGHERIAVLDGGWSGWVNTNLEVSSEDVTPSPQSFVPHPEMGLIADAKELLGKESEMDYRIFDVRTPERFRGELEPIDLVAGRIPGAINAPYTDNLNNAGYFLPPDKLKETYQILFDGKPATTSIFYCGSGITAAQSILSVVYSGLGTPRLYPGSWSEWINDPLRPIATGNR